MKTVFIFGAGASRDTGAPLMGDFLDSAYRLHRMKDSLVSDAYDDFEEVFEAIADLQEIHAKSYINLDNIESLLGAIEMGMIVGRIGERDAESAEKLRDSVVTLIYKTLESTVRFPLGNSGLTSPSPYKELLDAIDPFCHKNTYTDHDFTFITFNYDVAFDIALHIAGLPYNYCFKGHNHQNAYPLLKLHGSINWGRCKKCNELVAYNVSHPPRGMVYDRYRLLPFGTELKNITHCNTNLESRPVIVPPTWNKTEYQATISNIWRVAADKLSEAENIFIIGYSLPETDAFFRYLYALSARKTTRLKRFWVFNPDETAKSRFESLIGPGITSRFLYSNFTFTNSIRLIKDAINAGWHG